MVVEDDGRQARLDQAACRDQDPKRFFPRVRRAVKAPEAKAIYASCQVRDHCLDLAVTAAGGIDGRPKCLRRRPLRQVQPTPR